MESQNESKSMKSGTIIKQILQFAKPWKFRFYFGYIGGSTAPIFYAFINSYIYMLFINLCTATDKASIYNSMKWTGIVLLVAIAFYAICFGLIFTTHALIAGKVKKDVFLHAEKLPVSYVESRYSGDFATKVTKDFNDAIQITGYPFVGYNNPLAMFITIVGISCIIFFTNWILVIISLVLGLLNLLVVKLYIKPLQEKEQKVKATSSEAAQEIVNSLGGVVVSRMFAISSYLKEKYCNKAEKIYDNNVSIIRKKTNIMLITDIQSFLISSGVVVVGLILSVNGFISISKVVFVANLQMTLSSTLAQLGNKIVDCQKYIVSAKRLLEFMQAPEEIERSDLVKPDLSNDYSVEMKDLTFSYQEAKNDVLHRLNLSIRNGEKIAIVGSSGGGKSTLLKLLMAFEEPKSGEIKLFGNGTELYNYKTIRSLFSYVPQDCYLFEGSIKENILLGNPNASEEEYKNAIKSACLEEFIEELPDGSDTWIGERGTKLSGGQKQRIAIARALMKDAPIILLDEATSSLDSASEKEVQNALDNLMKYKTSIVIAHRISTIKNMERIIVLENGTVLEEGTHDMLMQQDGRYKRLYAMQYI